ncbi:helix-turn-helix domain-containing protein [Christiangramia aquimixticola]|uniref:helix-turn-helix domain-containing protein n=1 Tax=Christiangramia aquimixticola TaxID=1697558 RepID=UPI003AA7AF29
MNTIAIQNIAANDIFNRLATEFKTALNNNYGEYSIRIPSRFGKGTITGINFPSGIGLFKFDVNFKDEQCFIYDGAKVHPFKFAYVLSGKLQHRFKGEDIIHCIQEGQSTILGAHRDSGNMIYFPENTRVEVILLDVNRKKFIDQIGFDLDEKDEVYQRIFADTEAVRTLYHHSQYSLKMAHLASELNTFKPTGLERVCFIGAKALELLSYMLMLYRDDEQQEEKQRIIRQKDLSRIRRVVNSIDQNLAELGTIKALAEKEGISEVKLQEGFQILFNTSVNEYIQQRRLETAMQLLNKTNKTISEIVYAIGFNSRSHFSKIFKSKYGVSPNHIRKGIKTYDRKYQK